MRILLVNRDGATEVHLYYPQGGAFPSGIEKIEANTAVLLDVRPGEVNELQREDIA